MATSYQGPVRAEPRCQAWNGEYEVQCELEAGHDGDGHLFWAPIEWTACVECGGSPEWDPKALQSAIQHEGECSRAPASRPVKEAV